MQGHMQEVGLCILVILYLGACAGLCSYNVQFILTERQKQGNGVLLVHESLILELMLVLNNLHIILRGLCKSLKKILSANQIDAG